MAKTSETNTKYILNMDVVWENLIKLDMEDADLVREIGLSRRGYQYYVSGEREPQTEILVKIADIFGIGIGHLVKAI